MSIPVLPILATVGVLMYALCKDKLSEIGRILFFCALLVLLLSMNGKAIHF